MVTLERINKEISSIYDISSISVPTTSGEFARRLNFVNMALRAWRDRYMWDELIKRATLPITSGEVILPSDIHNNEISLDTFGYVNIGYLKYRLVHIHDTYDMYSNEYRCYFLDNKLVFTPAPLNVTSIDLTYKTKNMAIDNLSNEKEYPEFETDLLKIKVPEYVVYWVVGELFFSNDEMDKASLYKVRAEAVIKNQIVSQTLKSPRIQMPYSNFLDSAYEPIGGSE
jgi:hypothetical protein